MSQNIPNCLRLDLRGAQGRVDFFGVRRKMHKSSGSINKRINLDDNPPTPAPAVNLSAPTLDVPTADPTPALDVSQVPPSIYRTPRRHSLLFNPWVRRLDDDQVSLDSDHDQTIIITSPLLSRPNRLVDWDSCGNVLMGQNRVSKDAEIEWYSYEIWDLGHFNDLTNTSSNSPSSFQSYISSNCQHIWSPFVDMRDVNDAVTLLPYQHDIAPHIPQSQ